MKKETKKISLADITLKEYRAKASETNVEVPKLALITSAHAVARRSETEKDENGNAKPIEGTCLKIAFQALDSTIVHLLEANGLSASQLQPFTIELEMPEADLLKIEVKSLVGATLSLSEATLAPLWVSRGRNGSYSGLKVIINEIEVVS